MIFISYRREDTLAEVTNLAQRLKQKYGDENVFVDFEDIPAYARWPDTLRDQLAACRIVLGVVGKRWGDARFAEGEDEGRFRLDHPDDWVRSELTTAIRRAKANTLQLFIVMIDEATLPKRKFRCELDELSTFQQSKLRNQKSFARDFGDLCAAMETAVPELTAAANKQQQRIESHSPDVGRNMMVELRGYAEAAVRSTASISLPLVRPNGAAVVAPMDELRIDLPLFVSHEHAPAESVANLIWLGMDPLAVNDEFRSSHTNALLVDRASRFDDAQRDCDFATRLTAACRIVVIGDPGCGKTTLLQWLTHHYALRWGESKGAEDADRLPAYNWVPILIPCRELLGMQPSMELSDVLMTHLRVRQFSENAARRLAANLVRLLEAGEAILLIDGLDEIPRADRRTSFCDLLTTVADRFPNAPMLVTSRVVGFQAVREQLIPKFDHLLVGPLDRAAKRTFVERWARLIHWPEHVVEGLVSQVCHSRVTAKLTDNVFLLALIVQLRAIDDSLPGRRVDVYRRTVELMAQRRQPNDGDPLSVNEVIPHLEFMAYWMRRKGVQRVTDIEATDLFRQLREQEPKETSLTTRDPKGLLWACVDSLGLLTVAGTETDDRGYDRKLLQFFHQSFQEYFASQAIKHGRGGIGGGVGAVAQIRDELSGLKVTKREVSIFGRYTLTEPVLANNWQEVMRMLIADLPAREADDAILMLLPGPITPPNEARPRAVFALQCLADEPNLRKDTVATVFDNVMETLGDDDGINTEQNTWMDEALAVVGQSRFGMDLRNRMIDDYLGARDNRRHRIGCGIGLLMREGIDSFTVATADEVIATARKGLRSPLVNERVWAALELTNRCYLADGRFGFLLAEQRARVLETLVAGAEADEATAAASLWALSWLTGARHREVNSLGGEVVTLPQRLARRVETVIQRPGTDIYAFANGVLVLNREEGIIPVFQQRDWIYDLAVVADGNQPRRALQGIAEIGRSADLDWLLKRPLPDPEMPASHRIVLSLGALGVFRPEMVPALRAAFFSKRHPDVDRSEAAVYLAMIRTPEAVHVLTDAADIPPEGDDDFLYMRGLLGLLYVDDVDVLAGQIRKALPHSDVRAYAYGLSGSQDPRGREILSKLLHDPNETIVSAAKAALENPKCKRS